MSVHSEKFVRRACELTGWMLGWRVIVSVILMVLFFAGKSVSGYESAIGSSTAFDRHIFWAGIASITLLLAIWIPYVLRFLQWLASE